MKRVLRKGGYFLCTDIRSPAGMETLKQQLLATGMTLLKEEDITFEEIRLVRLKFMSEMVN